MKTKYLMFYVMIIDFFSQKWEDLKTMYTQHPCRLDHKYLMVMILQLINTSNNTKPNYFNIKSIKSRHFDAAAGVKKLQKH